MAIESSQLETVFALVESGLGLSLPPRMAVARAGSRDIVFSIAGPEPGPPFRGSGVAASGHSDSRI
ncbi:MAG: hypothetical protein J6386_19570 [Candidatus Synoicihabitans palmerolidicus]|nr:hypothetical protein [Candidatus Synoicihabitans palmerolidicus]